jgi:hypothetical protein
MKIKNAILHFKIEGEPTVSEYIEFGIFIKEFFPWSGYSFNTIINKVDVINDHATATEITVDIKG